GRPPRRTVVEQASRERIRISPRVGADLCVRPWADTSVGPYSDLSPVNGSIEAARRAGGTHATTAVLMASATAVPKASVSPADTPYSRLASVRPRASAPA